MSAVALGGKVEQTPGEGTLHSSVGKCSSLGSDSFSGSAKRKDLCLPGSLGARTPA